MNKQELRKILKPLIKECIKEVIFEDGVLSSIISEVMVGTNAQIKEVPQKPVRREVNEAQATKKLQEQRKQMLDAIGRDSYNGVNVFEGTTPTTAPSESRNGPLSGTDPKDPGIDISNFAGVGAWKKLAGN